MREEYSLDPSGEFVVAIGSPDTAYGSTLVVVPAEIFDRQDAATSAQTSQRKCNWIKDNWICSRRWKMEQALNSSHQLESPFLINHSLPRSLQRAWKISPEPCEKDRGAVCHLSTPLRMTLQLILKERTLLAIDNCEADECMQ